MKLQDKHGIEKVHEDCIVYIFRTFSNINS